MPCWRSFGRGTIPPPSVLGRAGGFSPDPTELAAYNRIEAARASRRFPAILDLLADGSLNLSTARLLAPHLRPRNFESLVSMAKGRSKREATVVNISLRCRQHNTYEAELVFGSSVSIVRGVALGRPAPTGHSPVERNPGVLWENSPRGELDGP